MRTTTSTQGNFISGSDAVVSSENQTTQNELQTYENIGTVANDRFDASSEAIPQIHPVRRTLPPADSASPLHLQFVSENLRRDRDIVLAAMARRMLSESKSTQARDPIAQELIKFIENQGDEDQVTNELIKIVLENQEDN